MKVQHSLEAGLSALAALDLVDIKRKLMQAEPDGKGWNAEQVEEAEKWYRRYLEVVLRDETSAGYVPNYVTDVFWHTHILDTEAYARDCQNIFGSFLHHYQYLGLNGDEKVRDEAFVKTNEAYTAFFGEDCTSMKHFKEVTRVAMCEGTNCIGSGCRQHTDTLATTTTEVGVEVK